MIWFSATKAKDVGAGALNDWNDDVEGAGRDGAFDGIFTVGSGTPTEMGIVIDIGSIEEGGVASESLLIDQELDGLLIDNSVAFGSHTLNSTTFSFANNLVGNVVRVALLAETVVATERESLLGSSILEADLANESSDALQSRLGSVLVNSCGS
jgi:hypothetical protein